MRKYDAQSLFYAQIKHYVVATNLICALTRDYVMHLRMKLLLHFECTHETVIWHVTLRYAVTLCYYVTLLHYIVASRY